MHDPRLSVTWDVCCRLTAFNLVIVCMLSVGLGKSVAEIMQTTTGDIYRLAFIT